LTIQPEKRQCKNNVFSLSFTNVFWKEILFPLVAQEKLHQKSRNIITIPKLFNTINVLDMLVILIKETDKPHTQI
jgi:hypothetical protein